MNLTINIITDATILILTYGSKDRWADLVKDSMNDLFSTTAIDDVGGSKTIAELTSRIKQGKWINKMYIISFKIYIILKCTSLFTVPQRLINTQCGADYSAVGSSNSFSDYIEPGTIVSYRLHPNYFFSRTSGHESKIKVKFFSQFQKKKDHN